MIMLYHTSPIVNPQTRGPEDSPTPPREIPAPKCYHDPDETGDV